ncbi:hypothetical protein [Rhizobium sp. R693]|uniref:hypothetical protein n=1 Tax=Rhizobium sp. R693 TaxID=1764276 RepID=UPI0011307771|nr:hypothetical protein [Rhizobium sp. R693]
MSIQAAKEIMTPAAISRTATHCQTAKKHSPNIRTNRRPPAIFPRGLLHETLWGGQLGHTLLGLWSD